MPILVAPLRPAQGIEMPQGARLPARQAAETPAPIRSADRTPGAPPGPRTVQAQLLQFQRSSGNQAVQRLIRAGGLQPGPRIRPLPQRQTAQDGQALRQPDRHAATQEATSIQPARPAPRITPLPRQASNAPRIQNAWYNFDIPFTDYQFDPSLEGIKTAAGIVKDKAVEALDWIVDEIKGLVESGIQWLTDKWHSLEDFVTSALKAATGSFDNIVGFLKNPIGFLTSAIMSLDAQALQKAWAALSGLTTSLANGFKAMTDTLMQQVDRLWGGIHSFAGAVLSRISGLTENFLFRKLPDALQRVAFTVIDRLKALWKSINDGWTRLFNKVKAWVDGAIDKVFGFVRKVLNFGIQGVIDGIVQFGRMVLFIKDLFSDPMKYVNLLAQRTVQAFDGVESRFSGLVAQYFGGASGPQAAAQSPGTTKIHRAPAPGAVAKRSATWGEIGHGIAVTMGKKWEEFKANPMAVVKQLLMDLVLPMVGNISDIIELFKNIKKVVTGPLSAGSLEEFWTSLLQILDIPIMIYHTVVSILMRSLALPLIVATFIPHPLVKGIAAAVGYGLLGAFVQAEMLNLAQKLLLLKTGVTTEAQKEEAYNRIADSLIALAMTAVIMIVMLILHFIANVMKGVYGFVKGKVFGIEPTPAEAKGAKPVEGDPASKDAKGGDPSKGPKDGLPSQDGKRRIKINEEGRCEVCASPCDAIRKRYASVMTPEIEARIKLIEDNPSLTELQKEEALEPIEQELADLEAAQPKTPIKLDSPARIEATEPVQVGDKVKWTLFDSQSGAKFSEVTVDVSDPGNPGAPDQNLQPKNATLPDGTKATLDADFPFTDESLKKNQSVWEKYFKKDLTHYSGSIGEENLGNFQAEYDNARTTNPGLSPQELGDLAIRKVSFGTGRVNIGFGDLSVVMDGFKDVEIKMGPYKGRKVMNVPTKVSVWAGKTKP
jgi:hypothetical protein